VAILVAFGLDFVILEQILDQSENYLVVKCKINNEIIILASIYGPNSTDRQFFVGLERSINQLQMGNNFPVIMGGDWNTTWFTG